MAFNSFPFLIFILLFFIVWPFVKRKQNLRFVLLISSSFVFYGWWDWRFIFLIIISGLVDFFAAWAIEKYRAWGKFWLTLSILINLGMLSIFKYSPFFAGIIDQVFGLFSIATEFKHNLPEFTYLLPVGISFYTFQSMSYTIDVYRSKLKPTNNILHFFSYLVMFPQLVAGPIVRAKDFLYQLKTSREVSGLEFWNGIKLIILGYFQKMVLADNLGVFVDNAFAGVDNGIGIYWWTVMACFTFQIYFDFSGYTQIARGLAKLMGYHFRMNFNHPYLALSLKDFWSRWHISLSTWFRDYVYIPLGGNKKGLFRTHLNIWITMILSGLWHGAQLNFVLWGAYHGMVLSLERMLHTRFKLKETVLKRVFDSGVTIILVTIGWVLFRATSVNQIVQILENLFRFDFNFEFMTIFFNSMVFLVFAILFEGLYPVLRKRKSVRQFLKNKYIESIVIAFAIAAIIFLRGPEKEFIYFQF